MLALILFALALPVYPAGTTLHVTVRLAYENHYNRNDVSVVMADSGGRMFVLSDCVEVAHHTYDVSGQIPKNVWPGIYRIVLIQSTVKGDGYLWSGTRTFSFNSAQLYGEDHRGVRIPGPFDPEFQTIPGLDMILIGFYK